MKHLHFRTRYRVRFFCGLLVVFSLASYSSPQNKDVWLKLERKGQGYGYDHITVEKTANGNIKYSLRQHIKTDIAGFNPQDIIQEGYYIVDPFMKPVSLDLKINFQSQELRVVGECKNDTLHITRGDNSGTFVNYAMPFDDVYFEVVVGSIIYKKKNLQKFWLKIFSPIELAVNEHWVEVTRADKTGIEALVKDRITMKYIMDARGRVKEINFLELNSRSYMTSETNARNIDYLNTADGFTLTVNSPQDFSNVFDVTQAQIQLRWKEIPFDEFKFSDNRQKAILQTKEGEEYETVLEIVKPSTPSESIELPVQGEDFLPYLEDSEFIKPSAPVIRKKLAEIQGDEEYDPHRLVQKLLLWVYQNVKAEYTAETLTGPQVLERKRGKCSEYTTLFASLSRAAGIPTRIAFGEATTGKVWVGHLWCEVWLGDWVAVDAAAGIFVRSPSHLKFIDSPTLKGTQNIRWRLVDNLSIEILNFKEE